MAQRRCLLICTACSFLCVVAGLAARTLQIINTEGHSTTVSAAQIANSPHVTVNVKDHDVPAQFVGVPLATLLSSAGVPLGDTLRGPRLTEALIVEAADGYKVIFALAEIDPAFATREIIWRTCGTVNRLTRKKGLSALWLPATSVPHDGCGRSPL